MNSGIRFGARLAMTVGLVAVALVSVGRPRGRRARATTLGGEAASGAPQPPGRPLDGSNWVWPRRRPRPQPLASLTIRSGHTVTISSVVTMTRSSLKPAHRSLIPRTPRWRMGRGPTSRPTARGLNTVGNWTMNGNMVVTNTGTYIHNTVYGVPDRTKMTLYPSSTFIFRKSAGSNVGISWQGYTFGNVIFETTAPPWTLSFPIGGTNRDHGPGNLTIDTGRDGPHDPHRGTTIGGQFHAERRPQVQHRDAGLQFHGLGKTIGGAGAITFETWNINPGASITMASPVTLGSGSRAP